MAMLPIRYFAPMIFTGAGGMAVATQLHPSATQTIYRILPEPTEVTAEDYWIEESSEPVEFSLF